MDIARQERPVAAPPKVKNRKRKSIASLTTPYLTSLDRHLQQIFEITTVVLLAATALLCVVVYFRVQWLWRQYDEDKL